MRIALLTPYHPSAVLGGQERIVSDLASALSKKRAQVEILSLSEEESHKYSRLGHIPALLLLFRKKWDLDGFDVINAHGWASELVIGKKTRKPALVTMHGTIAQYMENVKLSAFKKIYSGLTQKRFEQNACDGVRHLAAVSDRQISEMERHYGCDRKKVSTLYNGIDTALFSPKQKEESKSRLGLEKYGKIALACGRMSMDHKGFDILLKLADRLGKDTALVVNGTVPENLRGMMKPNMIATKTSLPDMPYLYSAADVLVNPSRYEGFGLVTCEAMACGTPAVAFDTGAASELIGQDEGGSLIGEIGNANGFIGAALGLLSDPELAVKKGKAATARASKFTLDAMVGSYLERFESIV